MKFVLMFFVLFALPVSALEVSVTGGQARINATIKALQTKIVTLEASVKAQGDLTTSMNKCAGQKKLYDAVATSSSNPDGCTAPPIDPDALAEELSCKEGQTMKFIENKLVCVNPLKNCNYVVDEVLTDNRYSPSAVANPRYDRNDDESNEPRSICVKTNLKATILSSKVITIPSITNDDGTVSPNPVVPSSMRKANPKATRTYEGYSAPWYNKALKRVCNGTDMFGINWPRRVTYYRHEPTYTYNNVRLICK